MLHAIKYIIAVIVFLNVVGTGTCIYYCVTSENIFGHFTQMDPAQVNILGTGIIKLIIHTMRAMIFIKNGTSSVYLMVVNHVVGLYKWMVFNINNTFCTNPYMEVFCVWFGIMDATNLDGILSVIIDNVLSTFIIEYISMQPKLCTIYLIIFQNNYYQAKILMN